MEAPSSLKRFHLILAHDIRDTDSSRRSVHKFWAARFPDALITDFPFLDETSNVRFLNRAHALLSTIQEARESENYPVGPEEHLPNVFLCHGLGGSLVKQALVLASLDRNYGRYASDTALLILCSTPDAAEHMNMWQLEICRLLTVSDLGSYSVTSLLNELPEALERLYWSFGAIRRHHLIVDIEPRETGSNMVRHPLLLFASC
ncbi:hypothetical protein BJ166DRAFT_369997 [Pestalotiopsis sp. NC0098]|nr:hypothetical protein BJ166DRAFT_369997 [Pestalotiopsis sp. NC0098]